MSNNIFPENFDSGDFDDMQRRFRAYEARKEAPKTAPKKRRLSSETSDYVGLAVFRFLFIIIPLALLFAGIAVVPATEAIFNTEIGYWTAFFLLLTIRWLILQPRSNAYLWKILEESR